MILKDNLKLRKYIAGSDSLNRDSKIVMHKRESWTTWRIQDIWYIRNREYLLRTSPREKLCWYQQQSHWICSFPNYLEFKYNTNPFFILSSTSCLQQKCLFLSLYVVSMQFVKFDYTRTHSYSWLESQRILWIWAFEQEWDW